MKNNFSRGIIFIFAIIMLSSCGSLKNNVPDLTGEWEQAHNNSDLLWYSAKITEDTIKVYWTTNGGNTTSLYWSGTFSPPQNNDEHYSWESQKDESEMDESIFASMDNEKTFTYKDGEISYSMSALGIETSIVLEKTKESK